MRGRLHGVMLRSILLFANIISSTPPITNRIEISNIITRIPFGPKRGNLLRAVKVLTALYEEYATKKFNNDGRLIRADYVLAKPRLAARSNIIALIKRLAVYSFFSFPTGRSYLNVHRSHGAALAFGSCLFR
jgi:hypothetical protein